MNALATIGEALTPSRLFGWPRRLSAHARARVVAVCAAFSSANALLFVLDYALWTADGFSRPVSPPPVPLALWATQAAAALALLLLAWWMLRSLPVLARRPLHGGCRLTLLALLAPVLLLPLIERLALFAAVLLRPF